MENKLKILITGHKGYIGSHLYKELEALGHEVCGVDLKDGEDILFAYRMNRSIMFSIWPLVQESGFLLRTQHTH